MEINFKRVIFETVSFIISVLCFVYVAYRTGECWSKYNLSPNSTESGIEPASEHPYPAFSICYDHAEDWYAETLASCGLTFNEFFLENKWVGNGEPFCQDPQRLYETMTSTKELLKYIKVIDQNSKEIFYNSTQQENLYYLDGPEDGRCIAFYPPENIEIGKNLNKIVSNFSKVDFSFFSFY